MILGALLDVGLPLEDLQQEDIDFVDIGRAILDAPLTDFRYDVVKKERG